MIHPSAVVSPQAQVGEGVSIGPFAIVEAGAVLGDRCVVRGQAVVCTGSVLGPGVVVDSFAVVGGLPQHLKFDPATPSGVRIGAGTVLREGVTVNRSTRAGEYTVVGEQGYLMANCHVAHDCRLGDRVVIANGTLLAGHVEVGDGVFIGGNSAVHQFCRIGEGVMLGGMSGLSKDLPPFLMAAERDRVVGLNSVGLRRRGCSREAVAELKTLYRRVYGAPSPREEAAALLASGLAASREAAVFLAFFAGGKRGIVGPRRKADGTMDDASGGE
jgi:UDP-N-acetylglucosamine acyltransferase